MKYLLWFCILPALTGPTAMTGESQNITLKWGAGLRSQFTTFDRHLPRNDDVFLDGVAAHARLFLSGVLLERFSFEINIDRRESGELEILDNFIQWKLHEGLKLQAGQFLIPADRSQSSGPFYLHGWDFPMVQRYPSIAGGRDQGLGCWGLLAGGRLKYHAGVFRGRTEPIDDSAQLLYAGRVAYAFWDPEPGFYDSSTYFGKKEIFSIGASFMSKANGFADGGDFSAGNVDLLVEKRLGEGTASLEASFYDYDSDGFVDSLQGDGLMVLAGYLFPRPLGSGRLQCSARFQVFSSDRGQDQDRVEMILQYLLKGHDAKFLATYALEDPGSDEDRTYLRIGSQFQFP